VQQCVAFAPFRRLRADVLHRAYLLPNDPVGIALQVGGGCFAFCRSRTVSRGRRGGLDDDRNFRSAQYLWCEERLGDLS